MKRFVNLSVFQLAKIISLLTALILCFWDFNSWSITNDELSALNRLQYNNFSDLIQLGIKPDGHPASVQIFLFLWTKLFGTSVWAIRLPSVLLSFSGLVLFFKLSERLINSKAALVASNLLILSQYFLMHAQIARPYAYGFFAITLLVYSGLKLNTDQNSKRWSFAFIVAICLAMSSHYFAAFSAVIYIILNFILFSRSYAKKYLTLCFVAALILSPHIPITINQLGIGGLSWLPLANSKFFTTFLSLAFNQNLLFGLLPIAAIIAAIYFNRFEIKLKEQVLLLIMGTLPTIVGYYYSYYVSPVLQFSTLYFSFPFLLLFCISIFRFESSPKFFWSFYGLSLLAGLFSLSNMDQFFSNRPFANYKAVIEESNTIKDSLKTDLVAFANSTGQNYFDYYSDANSNTFDISLFDSTNKVAEARDLINNSPASHLLLSFAASPIPLEVYDYAKAKYPFIKVKKDFFNSQVLLLRKGELDREVTFSSSLSKQSISWKFNPDKWIDTLGKAKEVYLISKETEYDCTFITKLSNIGVENNSNLSLYLRLKSNLPLDAKVVVDIQRQGTSVQWQAYELEPFYIANQWFEFRALWQKNQNITENEEVLIYLWNPNGSEFLVDEFMVSKYTDNDFNFYKR